MFSFSGRSILKLRLDKAAKSRTHGRKAPKVDVKLTRTTQLRLIKADPLFDLSKLEIDEQCVHFHLSLLFFPHSSFLFSTMNDYSHPLFFGFHLGWLSGLRNVNNLWIASNTSSALGFWALA